MIKKGLCIVSVIIVMMAIAGCSKEDDTLTIGLMPSEDAIPFVIAQDKGYLNKDNVTLEFYKSAKDRDAALQAGALDGIICDQIAIGLYQNADVDMRIVSETTCNFYFVASAGSGVTKLNELAGKSIAISENTVIDYTVDRLLESVDIQPSDVTKTAISAIPNRVEMLSSNQVDAAVLPEPFASLAIANGGVLLGKAADIGLKPTVIAFKADVLENKKESVESLLDAYNQGVDYANTTPISDYETLVIDTIGFPESMAGDIHLPTFSSVGMPSDAALTDALMWLDNKGILTKTLTPADLKE